MRAIVFGEVLFDRFPDGENILGGAPFNVAWHLQGFGAKPLMITRLGDDEAGHLVLDRMKDWSMDVTGVQIDREHPTGTVEITLEEGQPSYDIRNHQAYDFCHFEELPDKLDAGDFKLLYNGSLALRNQQSKDCLHRMVAGLQLPRFVDINLRKPWYELSGIRSIIDSSRWLKLNDEEFREIMAHYFDGIEERSISEQVQMMRREFGIYCLILTFGEKGAKIFYDHSVNAARPPSISHFEDAVGAGDAFSSVFILGQLKNWSMEKTLDHAIEFAAEICKIQGATTENRKLYERMLESWG